MSRPREAFCFRLQPQSLQTKIGRNQSQWEFVGQWQSAIIRNWQSQIEAGIKVNVNQDPLLKHVWRNRVPKPKMSSHNLAPTNQQQCVRVDFSAWFPCYLFATSEKSGCKQVSPFTRFRAGRSFRNWPRCNCCPHWFGSLLGHYHWRIDTRRKWWLAFFSGPTNSSPYEETVVSNLIISSEVFLNENKWNSQN